MASSYSTDLKIELMVTGENAGTWGEKTNDNLNVIQQAIAGFKEVSIAGGAQTTNLLINNSPDIATSDARNAVIKLTGTITGNQIVTVPTGIQKTYIVQNGTTGAFTVQFIQSGGTGTTFSTTDKGIKILFADGTNINTVDLDTLSGAVATAQIEDLAVTSSKLASFAVTSARLASFAVTESRLASFAVTTSRLATNAVTGVKITQSTITQSKLAANSVGADQLISTGVTAATYTAATVTVDADGRITAASSGSGGAGGFVPTLIVNGPTSGTFTATPSANRLAVYLSGSSGAGGPMQAPISGSTSGGGGGAGGMGFYNKPIAQPFSQPYAVGATGGNATVTNVGTANAGNAGGVGPNGNPGNAPGASLTIPQTQRFAFFGEAGGAGTATAPMSPGSPGNAGPPGAIVIFENTGT